MDENDDDVVEDSEEVKSIEEDLEDAEEEDGVGIFDDDLEEELGGALEDVLEDVEEGVSDFFIGDTILSTGNGESGWSKEDLEEFVRKERIERDWKDSEEFVGGNFDSTAENFYATKDGKDGFYKTERGGDLYKGGGEGDLYNTGEAGVYTGKKGDDGSYEAGGKEMKSYDEIENSRRRGRSMLEIVGFEDKEKQKERTRHDLIDYGDRKVA